jgi:hypothetical protein
MKTFLFVFMIVFSISFYNLSAQSVTQAKEASDSTYESELETIKGQIEKINYSEIKQGSKKVKLVNIDLKTDNGTYVVLLGPVSHLEKYSFAIAVADNIEAKGFTIPRPDMKLFAAVKLIKGDQEIKLLDWGERPLMRRGKMK